MPLPIKALVLLFLLIVTACTSTQSGLSREDQNKTLDALSASNATATRIIIEAENAVATGYWKQDTDHPGYSGPGYLEWTGPNFYKAPNDDILSYPVTITDDGVYRLHLRVLRSKEGREDVRWDLENDLWVRVGEKHWIKTYFHGPWDQWVWTQNFDLAHYTGLRPAPELFLQAGSHTLQIAGRSERVRFDRFVLLKIRDK